MAYTATVVSPMKRAERICRSMGIYSGKVAVSEYNQTLAEITAITKYFKPTSNATTGGFRDGIVTVQFEGPSSLGYLAQWDYTTGSVKCFYADKSTSPTASGLITLLASATMSAANNPVLWNNGTAALGSTGTAGTTPVTVTVSAVTAAAASECANAVNAGTFGFIAIGFI
jgi:hypothetical protein